MIYLRKHLCIDWFFFFNSKYLKFYSNDRIECVCFDLEPIFWSIDKYSLK